MRDRALGSTIRIYFTTHTLSTGVVVAPSSAFVAADFKIYKDGSATEKTSTNGITVTSPFDSQTGAHLVEIDTSNSTGDSGFWASGSAYRVVLSTAKTVDSKDPSGVCVGEFSLELQTADVRKFGGTNGTFAAGIPTAALSSAARVKLDATQPDYAPATVTALTTVGNNVTAILEDTGTTIPTQITALNNLSSAQVVSALGTGTWATALPWNAAWDAEVQSEVQDAIEVNNLDHLVKIAVDTNFATTVHLDSIIGHMADNGTTATFSRTTDSLEAIRDNQTAGSGASLSDIIAGVQSVSGAIVEAQNSATLSIRIGDTWTQDIESLGDLTDKTVSFALKKRASDADTAAIVFIVEGTGLTKLNGAATTAGWGSITILDEVAGDIRLRLESNATSLLTSGSYVDAVKVLENGDDRTLRNAGRTVVSAGVIADIT